MRVLVYGVNSRNKGSQLLLEATARSLIAMGHTPLVSVTEVDTTGRRSCGAVGVVSVERLGAVRSLGLDLLPVGLGRHLPFVGDARIDYVVDASGYSLTDHWGTAPARSRIARLARWRARGVGYSMLPQAFGPFAFPDVAAGARTVFEHADRIWARDLTSREHVLGLLDGGQRVDVAPDVTIGLPVTPDTRAAGGTLLVPNWNIAKRSGPSGRQRYVEALVAVALELQRQGRRVIGLSHEGAEDLRLITEVAGHVPGIEVLDPASGLDCKRIIAGADLVISARYHALVSALSAGVPVIGHSWSHKYRALLDDFEVEGGLADPLDPRSTLGELARAHGSDARPDPEVIKDLQDRVGTVWNELEKTIAAA